MKPLPQYLQFILWALDSLGVLGNVPLELVKISGDKVGVGLASTWESLRLSFRGGSEGLSSTWDIIRLLLCRGSATGLTLTWELFFPDSWFEPCWGVKLNVVKHWLHWQKVLSNSFRYVSMTSSATGLTSTWELFCPDSWFELWWGVKLYVKLNAVKHWLHW